MYHTSFGNAREGMNVCDRDNNKIGTVKAVNEVGRAVGVGIPSSSAEGYLQVETGLLGLGKDLYIPFSAIRDCTDDTCFLNVRKDDVNRLGWDQRPANL